MAQTKTPLLNSTLRWFLFAMILANIASAMVFTVLSLYLTHLGASVGQVGLVYSTASVVPLILQILGGWLSDSIGRLRTIAIGSAAATLGYLGFVLAPSWEWVLVALCLEYISGSLVGPSFGAFIADQSSEESRGRVYGLSISIFLVVGVVGPPLGGWLVDWRGFKTMMLVAFILYAGASALRIWMATTVRFGETQIAKKPTLTGLRSSLSGIIALLVGGGILTWILLTDGVSDISSQFSNQLQPLYVSQLWGLSVTQIGWLQSILSAVMMIVTFPSGWLSDHFSERRVIAAGFMLQFIGLVIFLTANGFYIFALSAAVLGAGFGMVSPAYDALVSKAVPEQMRGIAFGFFRSSLGVISLPAPWIGAQLWERFSPRTPFLLTAMAALISTSMAWFKLKLPPKVETVAQEAA